MIRNRRSGFTLTELLIVIAINIIALFIAVELLMVLNKDYKILVSYLNSYLKGREMIDYISKDCRTAVRVMDSCDGYTTTDSTLVLKVPSIDLNRNIIDINNEFDYIIYRIENGDLWKRVIPGLNSSRGAYDGVLRKAVESLYAVFEGIPLSNVEHKSSITHLTLWVSISETVMGKEYRINPGTTVKLMNYEWEFVR